MTTRESEQLRTLARDVVSAAVAQWPIRAVLLAGSAARGDADRFSDIDLLVYVDRLPGSDGMAALRDAVGGTDPVPIGEPTEQAIAEQFTLGGVRVQVAVLTVQPIDEMISKFLEQPADLELDLQKPVSGIVEGLALHGEELIADWQRRLGQYPEALRTLMIERHWKFFPVWWLSDYMAARDCELWRLDMLLEGAFNLLGVLAGLNRVYFARFQFKGMRALVAQMTLSPPLVADRIEGLFRMAPDAAAQEFGALVEETRQLVARELPALTLSLPYPPGARQQQWG